MFADVVGQKHITNVLASEVCNESVSHAYLFCGSRGTGKTTCAKILAKAVNCEHPENGDPCGVCDACRLAESSFDIVEMDAASNNGVDEIRQLRESVLYPPTEMKKKVYIIDEVHMLSASAFNALLKTLEEPPKHVLFILATTELNKIPATILSRCKRFDFHRITPEDVFARLKLISENEQINASDGALKLISRLATGAMRDALSMLELFVGSKTEIDEETAAEILGVVGRESVIELMDAIGDKELSTAIGIISRLHGYGKDLGVLCSECSELLRDLLLVKYIKNPAEYIDGSEEELNRLRACAEKYTKERLVFCTEILGEASSRMAKSTFSRRMCVESAVMRMCDVRLSDISEVTNARIAELEAKVASLEAMLNGFAKNGGAVQRSVPVESPVASGDMPPFDVESPVASGDMPQFDVDLPMASGDMPPFDVDSPMASGDMPPFDVDSPMASGEISPFEADALEAMLNGSAKKGGAVQRSVPVESPMANGDMPPFDVDSPKKKGKEGAGIPDIVAPSGASVELPFGDTKTPAKSKVGQKSDGKGERRYLEAYAEIAGELKAKDRMFSAFLNDSCAYFDGDVVKIELSSFAYSFVSKSDSKINLICDTVEKYLGYRPQVVVVASTPTEKSGGWDI